MVQGTWDIFELIGIVMALLSYLLIRTSVGAMISPTCKLIYGTYHRL